MFGELFRQGTAHKHVPSPRASGTGTTAPALCSGCVWLVVWWCVCVLVHVCDDFRPVCLLTRPSCRVLSLPFRSLSLETGVRWVAVERVRVGFDAPDCHSTNLCVCVCVCMFVCCLVACCCCARPHNIFFFNARFSAFWCVGCLNIVRSVFIFFTPFFFYSFDSCFFSAFVWLFVGGLIFWCWLSVLSPPLLSPSQSTHNSSDFFGQ